MAGPRLAEVVEGLREGGQERLVPLGDGGVALLQERGEVLALDRVPLGGRHSGAY